MNRPRPRILWKKRPEVKADFTGEGKLKESDRNINLGVPKKLRQGSQEAMSLLARQNAAMGGL